MSVQESSADRSVLVAVSGGVDSSVAALLLAEHGYRVRAVNLKLYCYGEEMTPESCCSLESTEVARDAMRRLGADLEVIYLQDLFREKVIEPFFAEYRAGRTPNPCVACNAGFRFPLLARLADEMGCRFVATGHYARVVERDGVRYLARGIDPRKDQSYFLWGIPREILDRVLFPVGGLTKPEVRERAAKANLPTATRRESQEVCFLPSGGYRAVLVDREGPGDPGPIVDQGGRVLGQHAGIVNYTVGQRKGIGVAAPHPLYVLRIDRQGNKVVVGPKEALLKSTIRVTGFQWFGEENADPRAAFTLASESESISQSDIPSGAPPNSPPRPTHSAAPSHPVRLEAEGAIRYRNPPRSCVVETLDQGNAIVRFEQPQSAPTPGQSLVLYRGELVMGGGIIAEAV